jgi:hypothetical protein
MERWKIWGRPGGCDQRPASQHSLAMVIGCQICSKPTYVNLASLGSPWYYLILHQLTLFHNPTASYHDAMTCVPSCSLLRVFASQPLGPGERLPVMTAGEVYVQDRQRESDAILALKRSDGQPNIPKVVAGSFGNIQTQDCSSSRANLALDISSLPNFRFGRSRATTRRRCSIGCTIGLRDAKQVGRLKGGDTSVGEILTP